MADVRFKIGKQLRELLETTEPKQRGTEGDALVLRDGLEKITATLEAGVIPGPSLAEIRGALVKEGLPPTGADYVCRVLDKMGVP